jgi:hypothetical protein
VDLNRLSQSGECCNLKSLNLQQQLATTTNRSGLIFIHPFKAYPSEHCRVYIPRQALSEAASRRLQRHCLVLQHLMCMHF